IRAGGSHRDKKYITKMYNIAQCAWLKTQRQLKQKINKVEPKAVGRYRCRSGGKHPLQVVELRCVERGERRTHAPPARMPRALRQHRLERGDLSEARDALARRDHARLGGGDLAGAVGIANMPEDEGEVGRGDVRGRGDAASAAFLQQR